MQDPATVRARPGRSSALLAFHCKSVLYGSFVWYGRARRLPSQHGGSRPGQMGGSYIASGGGPDPTAAPGEGRRPGSNPNVGATVPPLPEAPGSRPTTQVKRARFDRLCG
jgi:hypothetical protein